MVKVRMGNLPSPEWYTDESSSSTSSSETDATSNNAEDDSFICSLCPSRDQPTICVKTVTELQSIRDYIEVSSTISEVKRACGTCLFKFHLVIEKSILNACKEERERRLKAVADLIDTTKRIKLSKIDNTLLPASPIAIEMESKHHNITGDEDTASENQTKLVSPIDHNQDDEEPSELPAEEPNDNSKDEYTVPERLDSNLNSNMTNVAEIISNTSSCTSHLDVMYERSESALITESGGDLDQYKKPPLQCRYCPKVFILRKPFQKHMRSHQNKLLSCRSGSTTRGRTTPSHIVYACTDCSATFDSSAKLKVHCRIHLKRYYCTFCHKESLSSFDHDFHEAECRGEHMAKEELVETRRMTRSIARSKCSTCVRETPRSTYNTKRSRKSKSPALRVRRSSQHEDDDDDEEEEDDDDDCATSVAYTDYTAINRYVDKWVAGTCQSEYGSKINMNSGTPSENSNPVIVSQKEFEIIMLERLIIQADRNVYSCRFPSCDYATNTLRDMCLHEILIHKSKTFFSCRKCRGVFTSKLYLDYHMYMQNYAEYHCNKCEMRFNYEYQLQYHLLQHQNHDPYPCLYCDNSYTSSKELRIHSLETGHDPKKRKKVISIDHTMTIVNKIKHESPPPKRKYKCTIHIMDLRGKPRKKPLHMIWPREKKIFLGDIDFEYDPGRNCVRTK